MYSLYRQTAVAAVLLVFSAGALAQQSLTGATVAGMIQDPSGAFVQDAQVKLLQEATSISRSLETNRQGRFRFPTVAPGSYVLSVTAQGFQRFQRKLQLYVGQAFDIPVVLTVSGADQVVEVTSAAPVVDTLRTQISASVRPQEVESLPLNGRNYLDMALLVPNVSRTNTGSTQRFAETSAVPGTGISVAGQRNLNNTFLVDGLSANDDAAELAGTFFSQEVVQEFEVVTSAVAEYGRASGGAINIITRSGGNAMHGDAYGFLRNQRLDASNPLTGSKLPLTQGQYGASLGGPVVRERTFYFGNFEQTRQNTAGIVTIDPADLTTVNTELEARGYPGQRLSTGVFPSGLDTTNLFGRVDQRWNDSLQSAARYSFYDVNSTNARAVGGLSAESRGTALENRDQTLALNNVWTISPRTLHESRFQFTRSRLAAPVNDISGPAVNISGVASFGTATFSPTGRDIDLFQLVNNLSHQRGSHSLKAGVDYLHNSVDILFPGALQGVYSFSSLANFQAGRYINFQQAFGEPSTSQSNPNLGLFFEDEWKARPGLTVHAGLRYDLQFLPEPVQTDTNNFSPRIGVAWDPWRNGKTVLRANYGLFYSPIPLRAVANALQRDGSQYQIALLNPNMPGAPVFPNVLTAFPAGLLADISTIDPNIRSSYSHQGSLQIAREFAQGLSFEVGYMTLRGHGLVMSRNINVPTTTNPAVFNLGRPDPTHANDSQYQSIGDSWYDGMTLAVNKRAGSLASFRLSYTLSKTLDTAGNFFFSRPQDNFDIAAEKGRSDNDQRHRLVVSGSLYSPLQDYGSFWRAAASDWRLSWIVSYASALPFNILAGADLNGDTSANDRPAGVGRNTGDGFGFSSVDLRLTRKLALADNWQLELMADAFNLLNHRNNMFPNGVFGTSVTPRANFGQPTGVGDPRQVQLGLRLAF